MVEQFGQNWESQENLEWYKRILGTSGIPSHEQEDEEECDCLEEEVALHI